MTLVAFLQAQNCSNYPASWRHPESATDFMTARYYQRMARTLEDGKFHLAFFDDRLAMPDRYGDDFAESVRHGVRVVKMDPVTVLTVMGMATQRLGLGATYSTTYYEPFHVARVFATLDHLAGGRAAWNVVTSLNDSEAANMGQEAHLAHDLRYDRADEFMEVVLGHWDSWEDDALVLDRERGAFADPAKVHRLDHRGRWLRSRGPFTVPRSPQGRPVIVQAGQSGRGRRFAARWGELLFRDPPRPRIGSTRVPRDQGRRRRARARSCPGHGRARGVRDHRGDEGGGRRQGLLHRGPRPAGGHPGPAVRGAQLRLRRATDRRAVQRRGAGVARSSKVRPPWGGSFARCARTAAMPRSAISVPLYPSSRARAVTTGAVGGSARSRADASRGRRAPPPAAPPPRTRARPRGGEWRHPGRAPRRTRRRTTP